MRQHKTLLLKTIYSGFVNGKSKAEIERELRRIGKHDRLTKLAISTTKRVQDTSPSGLVVLFLKSAYVYKANLIINQELRENETQEKYDLINDMLSDTSKPFFLASMHGDSAADHKEYQGLLYYDENATGEALEYAKLHNLRTVQWVTGDPVYFITRPHCRHYFIQCSLEDVMKGVKPPTHKIGVRHGSKSFYQDRLETFKALYKVSPSPLLKRKIQQMVITAMGR